MLEKLSGIKNLRIEGRENLEAIATLNAQGRTVIFAPNHIAPQGTLATLRRNSAFADDFPVLNKVLEDAGINSKIIARGDTDMEVGQSKINKIIYNTHRRIFSALVKLITGGIPVAINARDPGYASQVNMPAVRVIFSALKNTNLTIYPYGNWFESEEQTFEENDDLQDGNFVDIKDFDQWRKSLKDGFIKIAKKSGTPIIPIYVENKNGEWCIVFGKPIMPDKKSANNDLAKRYLAAMRELKAKSAEVYKGLTKTCDDGSLSGTASS